MTDRIDFGGEPWQAIPRRVLRDARLSARAKGGLVTLLSHEEGWVRSCIAVLQNECAIGRNQAKAIMAELREFGYAEMFSERREDSNLMKTRYVVSAVPTSTGSQPDLFSFRDDRKPDGPETGRTGNGAAVVEALDLDPPDEDPQGLALAAPRPANPLFDALAELDGGREGMTDEALTVIGVKLASIKKATPTVTVEEIRRRAAILPLVFPQATVTAPSLAKHWAKCAVEPRTNGRRDNAAEILKEAMRRGFDPSDGSSSAVPELLSGS